MGVGKSFTAVTISPVLLALYTDPWPPVFSAPMFSSPVVIEKIFAICGIYGITVPDFLALLNHGSTENLETRKN
jgi:hypothetical protein